MFDARAELALGRIHIQLINCPPEQYGKDAAAHEGTIKFSEKDPNRHTGVLKSTLRTSQDLDA
jgi:hypothetical protein